ncbi:MAG: pantoate--beta-alanine ligase [Lysinibacillus sp.]
MQVIHTVRELRDVIANIRAVHKTIGLVPTMGFLHEGHLTLATEAKQENDIVVMSIFVNPTQFGPNEDFDAYPRDLPRDVALAETVGVDYIFAPSVEEMYPTDGGIYIRAGRQAELLCGASRPGHFDGVLQVVAKLFNLVQPTKAYFGQKDAQQLAIIQTMVRDYNFPLEIRSVPIVREESGLAKSSRNVYLTDEDREKSVAIYNALQLAKEALLAGEPVEEAVAHAKLFIEAHTGGRIDYVEALSYPDLTPFTEESKDVLIAAAVFIGKTRLIDNVMFKAEKLVGAK